MTCDVITAEDAKCIFLQIDRIHPGMSVARKEKVRMRILQLFSTVSSYSQGKSEERIGFLAVRNTSR